MVCILLAMLSLGTEPNLVQNQGFEALSGTVPDHWNLFVMQAPMLRNEDAPHGRTDTVACQGQRSVFLCNPTAYRNEPCNNWSQTVWGNWAGKKLRLSGMIKSENATAAAIWLQCWQRTPYKLLHVASTSDNSPVTGTADWKKVEMTVEVPDQTSFVIIRCVLRGKGKAWFDDISVSEIVETPPAPAQEPAPAPTTTAPAPAPKPAPEPPDSAPTPPTPAPAETNSNAQAGPPVEELEAMLQSLKDFSRANQNLSDQVVSLQQEIQALRNQLKALQELATTAESPAPENAAPAASEQKRVPPLVPHQADPDQAP